MSLSINNSHDKFFKETFSNKEEATDLLRNALPKPLLKNLKLNTLQLDKTSYIDEELKESFSDLVFDCKYKGETNIKISILIEHKSYTPDYPHIQLLKYLLKIWETNIKQKQDLVPVIPIIFYHGKEKWKSINFSQYFKGIDQNIEPFLPAFNYLLTDLYSYTDTEIENLYKAITVQMSLLLMKSIFNEEIIKQNLFTIFSGVEQIIETERGKKFLMSILLYIYSNTEIESDVINKTITEISNIGGQIAMTTAIKLEQKGRQEGMQKGILKGKKEDIINLFKLAKLSVIKISEYLRLDKRFVEETLKEHKLI